MSTSLFYFSFVTFLVKRLQIFIKEEERIDDIIYRNTISSKGAVDMRIDAINKIYETYKANGVSNSKKVNKSASRDEVALSDTAKDFQTVYKALANVPDVREDKVNIIKEQMASGTYNVKASEVAEKMLSRFDIRG